MTLSVSLRELVLSGAPAPAPASFHHPPPNPTPTPVITFDRLSQGCIMLMPSKDCIMVMLEIFQIWTRGKKIAIWTPYLAGSIKARHWPIQISQMGGVGVWGHVEQGRRSVWSWQQGLSALWIAGTKETDSIGRRQVVIAQDGWWWWRWW